MGNPILSRRFVSFVLALVLCAIWLLPATVQAAQPETQEEDLFAGYVQQQLYQGGASVYSSSYGEAVLTSPVDLALYRILKAKFEELAAQGGAASVTIPDAVFASISKATGEEMDAAIADAMHLGLVVDCLLMDCPYEQYWYDKTKGLRPEYAYRWDMDTGTLLVTGMQIDLNVAEPYQAENYDPERPAMTTQVSSVAKAIQNAKAVVADNAAKTDEEKLLAYGKYITDSVSYNHNAPGTAYGDAWQLIYVFDGDPNTNVVCEGYAKAFQYLCELSEFTGDVSCYGVSGHLRGPNTSGGHMWNVVSMNGTNYIVDVTNSDEESIGWKGGLFLEDSPIRGDHNGYAFLIDGFEVSYTYDEETHALYSGEMLTLGKRPAELFDLYGANLKLGDSLTMYFYIPVDKLEGDGYYTEVVRYYTDDPAGRYEDDPNAPKSESYTVQFTDWEEYSDTWMRVPYEGLAAKEMIDEIHVTVYNSEGKAVSHTWVDSVEKYCLRMAGNTAQDSKVRAMCVALLNYGAESQKFFTYSQAEATLANRGAAAYQSLIPQVDMPENRQVKCDGYVGSSLDLESEVVMTVYFSNMSRDMYATFSYTDHYGDTYSQRVEGSEFFERSASGNIYGVKVRGMSMGDYDQVVTVNVYKADGTHVYTIKDSMGSYLRRMWDKNNDDFLYRETATAMAMAHACLHRNDK